MSKLFINVRKSAELGRRLVLLEDIVEVISSDWSVSLYLRGRSEPMCLDETVHGVGCAEDILFLLRTHTLGYNPEVKAKSEVSDVAF